MTWLPETTPATHHTARRSMMTKEAQAALRKVMEENSNITRFCFICNYINQIIEDAPYYCLLYKIRPGLTSWGPIKIGYSDTIEKMVERLNYDIIYMEDMSLLNDLQIMILTIEILFKGKGV